MHTRGCRNVKKPSPNRARAAVAPRRGNICLHAVCAKKCKNVAGGLGGIEKNHYLRSMKAKEAHEEKWVVTGKSRLDGFRYEISGPMTEDQARQRLAREQENRSRQRFPAYTRLRVERRLPTQLTIKFNDYD